ncbi:MULTISPECIES: DUF5329 family protein [unclassified Rhizobacter]|uniref:DUF5329 family protein n=1 Tax=unclassified Rhizobacter TaxID=2640088 RepID=UPI0006F26C66|nr:MULTISPECIES: DUF5329 family protein [unclassified Rhizobacter]KQU68410.1 hypothetical protein ASC88_29075 [Rhizobacter sp. Root29]KQW14502.1 hypothetical protein ASC98_15115 [Rhizobacter sp. Root1238]KRB16708.1 hypothetical protein ASE08_25250 [Rhizobacter sp. Root16D2]
MRRRIVLVGLLAGAFALAARAAPTEAERARIERLIAYVAGQTGLKFVRNGSAHSPADAAKFLRGKFDKMGEHVNTAQQFIDEIASRSSTTGQAYLIRFADGRTVPVAQFLGDELRRMDR